MINTRKSFRRPQKSAVMQLMRELGEVGSFRQQQCTAVLGAGVSVIRKGIFSHIRHRSPLLLCPGLPLPECWHCHQLSSDFRFLVPSANSPAAKSLLCFFLNCPDASALSGARRIQWFSCAYVPVLYLMRPLRVYESVVVLESLRRCFLRRSVSSKQRYHFPCRAGGSTRV